MLETSLTFLLYFVSNTESENCTSLTAAQTLRRELQHEAFVIFLKSTFLTNRQTMNGFPETNICLDTKTEMRQLIHGSFVINDKKNMLNMLFKKILNLKDKQGTKAEKKSNVRFIFSSFR